MVDYRYSSQFSILGWLCWLWSASCCVGTLVRCRMPLRWYMYVILQHPTVRRLRTSLSSACPSTAFPSISLAEFSCPNSTQRRSPTNTRRSKRKAQESKPSKPEQPPFPSTRRSSTAVQKPHSNIPTQGYPRRIPNDKIVGYTN